MIDSKLPAGCEEAARRPPKSGVATATSTRRPRCTPNSTTFSRNLRVGRRLPPQAQRPRPAAADHGRRAHHAGDRPSLHGTAERPPVSGARRLPALAPVRLPATSVWLQQASARAHPTDRASDQLPRLLLAGVVRSVAAARFDPGPLRGLARDGSALRVRGIAAYGYCRSHSRYFWGFRLYLLCASDGTPMPSSS